MAGRQHNYDISKATVRNRLPVRAEPYWFKLGVGSFVGFRKTPNGSGTWVARWTEPECQPGRSRPRYFQEALGEVADMDFGAAGRAAQEYFTRIEREWRQRQRGIDVDDLATVEDALRLYGESLRASKGDIAADRAVARLEPFIVGKPFGRTPLDDLTAHDVERWRNSLVTPYRQKNTANRIFRQFVAVMNFAKKKGRLESDNAWKNVGQFPVRDGRREGYVDAEQRRALLAACDREKSQQELDADSEARYCTSDLGNLVRAAMFTGARPGELARARVSDFDERDKTLTLTSYKNKHGVAKPRKFFLEEAAALEFFAKLAKDRSPDELLLPGWYDPATKVTAHTSWSRGLRAAVRLANKALPAKKRMPLEGPKKVVMYVIRHSTVTDLLNDDVPGALVGELTGTSEAMMRAHYYQTVREQVSEKLKNRKSF